MKTRLNRPRAVAIAFACLVLLCYGVGKLVTAFFVDDEVVVTHPDKRNGGEIAHGLGAAVMTDESSSDEEITEEVELEAAEIAEEQDYDSNNLDYLPGEEEELVRIYEEELVQKYKELDELREAGKFERTFVGEDEHNGVTIRFHKEHFALSSGEAITMDRQERWKDGKLIQAGSTWGAGGWGGREPDE